MNNELIECWLRIEKNAFFKGSRLRLGLTLTAVIIILLFLLKACLAPHKPEHHYFHIARSAASYPFSQVEKGRNILAFSNDIIERVSALEEIGINVSGQDPPELYPGLDNGTFDAIMVSTVPYSPTKNYDYSEPIYLLGPVLIVHQNSDVHSLEQMDGKIIGIPSGLSLVFNIEKYPSIILRTYESPQSALANLSRNVIDGVIMDYLSAITYTTSIYAGQMKIATEPLTEEALRIVARKNTHGDELIHYFDSGIEHLKKEGEFDKLLEKWSLYAQ